MTDMSCSYGANRDEAIVAYLYADSDATDAMDGSAAQRKLFETHLPACARCRAEVAALRGVRAQLARWAPPEPSFAAISHQSSVISHQPSVVNSPGSARSPQWWRQVPVWAQVAAALLFLGVSAGVANLDVRYDQNGLSVRTGWSQRASGAGGAGSADGSGGSQTTAAQVVQPWKADLTALESQLKNEIGALRAAPAAPAAAVRTVSAPASDAEITRRLRALVDESEKRQKTELALRIAELFRDVNAQRQADFVKIDRTLGVVQNSVGIEVMKTRQQMNQMDLIYRASQRQ